MVKYRQQLTYFPRAKNKRKRKGLPIFIFVVICCVEAPSLFCCQPSVVMNHNLHMNTPYKEYGLNFILRQKKWSEFHTQAEKFTPMQSFFSTNEGGGLKTLDPHYI